MTLQASCVWPLAATLGEGPVWSVRDQCLWFVDIKRHQLHRHVPGQDGGQTWALPGQGGFALPARNGELVIGLPGELRAFDPRSGLSRPLQRLEEDRPGNRLNDGHVDAAGRLWFGSMDDAETALSGALYAWHSGQPTGQLTRHDDGICITNGPVTSPDGRTLYHTDTVNREIHAFDLAADGSTSGKRLFLRFDGRHGWPDGSTVDAEGCLWVAFFGGWGVRRYAPDGSLLMTVDLPCSNVTKLAFGGPDLRTAYVTTARKGLDEAALAAQPLAGGLFAFTAPVAGLPSTELVLPA